MKYRVELARVEYLSQVVEVEAMELLEQHLPVVVQALQEIHQEVVLPEQPIQGEAVVEPVDMKHRTHQVQVVAE